MPQKKSHKNRSLLLRAARLLIILLSSNKLYAVIVGLFAFQLIWLALVMNYPALFDEEYHLGIIEIYSRQFSPFITTQPPEAAFHGDITRYGSYLFHYLMSFPYSLISAFTGDIKTQVITMRLLCIGFIILGVLMWRKVLLRAGVSKAIISIVTLFFSLIPLSTLALSQLNYDSLAFLIIPSLFYLALRVYENKGRDIVWLLSLASLSLFGVLVKFTILPIAFVCVIFAVTTLILRYKKQTIQTLWKQRITLSKPLKGVLLVLVLVGSTLFIERYIVNLITYKNIEPKCDQVHTRQECMNYTVYKRDTTWRENNDKIGKQRDDPYTYTREYWYPHILNDYFIAGTLVYDSDQPLQIRYLPKKIEANGGIPILRDTVHILMKIFLFVVVISSFYLWKRYRPLFILTISVFLVYGISLWTRNYTDYLKIGTETAAQGRYFIPLLIPIMTTVVLSISHLARRLRYKVIILSLGLLLISQGGGISTFILKSKDTWYWQDQRQTISHIHTSARKVLDIFIRS